MDEPDMHVGRLMERWLEAQDPGQKGGVRRGRAAAPPERGPGAAEVTAGGPPADPLIDAHEVARILGVSENWVYDRAAHGELPSYKIGRTRKFRASEV